VTSQRRVEGKASEQAYLKAPCERARGCWGKIKRGGATANTESKMKKALGSVTLAVLGLILMTCLAQAQDKKECTDHERAHDWQHKCAKDSKDHAAEYQVGALVSTNFFSTGTVSQRTDGGLLGGSGVKTNNLGHNVSVISTPKGQYLIDPPSSAMGSILFGGTVDAHKSWFMDTLHEGDKVLFAAHCDEPNDCVIWVPKPYKVGTEIKTVGKFEPAVAKTNTNALCGTGRLSADVEAQVCTPQAASVPEPTPAPEAAPSPTEQAKQAQAYADCLKLAVDNPKIVCKQ